MPSTPGNHSYELLEHDEEQHLDENQEQKPFRRQVPYLWRTELLIKGHPKAFFISVLVAAILCYSLFAWPFWRTQPLWECDNVNEGYQCQPEISHYWGPYSPYFSVPSDISDDVSNACEVNFVQILSRHGAREPTRSKTIMYSSLIKNIHASVDTFKGKYAFLKDYQYTLGADQLTSLGQKHMVNSGTKAYNRYKHLVNMSTPFIRASGQQRVIDSARLFVQGFHEACTNDTHAGRAGCGTWPYPYAELSEEEGAHNPLDHSLCDTFEREHKAGLTKSGQDMYRDIFAAPITARLNKDLPGLDLDNEDTVMVMDLCPFETVASADNHLSPFCNLFTQEEWKQYDYYETLGKYYGFASYDHLGPTQGVGFTNELIARLTGQPVKDHTSVDQALDSDPKTFPLGDEWKIYADFSHDNDMVAILSAIGVFNETLPLSNTTRQDAMEAGGFSTSWLTPFGARIYFEKMRCQEPGAGGNDYVRVIVNDRVQPMKSCHGDAQGRCELSDFLGSLSFAKAGGRWDEC